MGASDMENPIEDESGCRQAHVDEEVKVSSIMDIGDQALGCGAGDEQEQCAAKGGGTKLARHRGVCMVQQSQYI
jgi:hypothetical protein